MARTLRFRPKPHSGEDGEGTPPPAGPTPGTFADKMQLLVLTRPIAAKIVEEFVERLLTEIGIKF